MSTEVSGRPNADHPSDGSSIQPSAAATIGDTIGDTIASAVAEANRQVEICNACRFCEGYCAVFPAIARQRSFSTGDITQLANLCHNCRGCYYACQYTEPHEFKINIPKALAEVRQESWQAFAFPSTLATAFHRSGTAIGLFVAIAFAMVFLLAHFLAEAGQADASAIGFYSVMSHGLMVAIFLPAFLLPLVSLGVSLRRYWGTVGGQPVRLRHLLDAIGSAATLRNLAGGHGEGCNFEDKDRFSNSRRHVHQMVVVGFLLCFASTSVATIMHYVFDMPAPYPLLSLPKLFGVVGGLLLSFGTLAMILMKGRGDRNLGDTRVWGGEFGFIVLLFLVSTSGLALYGLGQSPWLTQLLAFHLGTVLAFFLLTPYSKMAHGFYRMAALVRDAQLKPNQ